jgi:hypothetical protein
MVKPNNENSMKYIHIILTATLLWTTSVFALDMQVVGKIQQPIQQPAQQTNKPTMKAQASTALPATVTIFKVQLSDNAREKLQDRAATESQTMETLTSKASSGTANGVQLGMNNLPVFDQGPHNTCVMFATSAVISAALNRGDFISELCQLQLGKYLEKNGYTISGWDGSFGVAVLSQMQLFGIVNKETQRAQGCGGYTEYPTHTLDEPQIEISVADFHQMSEPMPEQIAWSSVLDAYQVFADKIDPNKALTQVIDTLNAGDRLIFGVLLFRFDEGIAGAVGKHNASYDTWILTPDVIKAINSKTAEVGGHEMIITGYNNNAIATDSQGRVHKGLLTLRNSWGSDIGDHGDFYMSYDYFKSLAVEAQRIRSFN